MSSGTILRLEQFLHGYREGHRLLEGSAHLSESAAKLMLLMTDLSGPSVVPGFESYLTGYPLPGVDAYALSRTWYAREMPRPGCVWTHTLVISFDELGLLQDLGSLTSFFAKPAQPFAVARYSTPLHLPLQTLESDWGTANLPLAVARRTLTCLYGSPDKGVILPGENAARYEKLILAVWCQQWPQLRCQFSFCSGAISPRTAYGKLLDLQVVPQAVGQTRLRDFAQAIVAKEDFDQFDPEWVLILLEDLIRPSDAVGSLRWFLRQYASRSERPRKLVRPHLTIYGWLRSHQFDRPTAEQMVSALARFFPSEADGTSLKSGVLNASVSVDLPGLMPRYSEEEILGALVATSNENAFEPSSLDVRKRAAELWKRNQRGATDLLAQVIGGNINRLGKELLLGIADIISPIELVELYSSCASFVDVLISRNPRLAFSRELWSGSIDAQEVALEAVARSRELDSRDLSELVAAMVEGGAVVAEAAVGRFGYPLVAAILDVLNASKLANLPPLWRGALEERVADVITWLRQAKNPSQACLALAASLLRLDSPGIKDVDIHVWLPLSAGWHHDDAEFEARVNSFLLAMSLGECSPLAAEILPAPFDLVHELAAEGRLPYDCWSLLETRVPSLGWWRDWDRCERLRRALVNRFVECHWESERFVCALKRPEAFAAAVRYASSFRGGRALLRELREQVLQGDLQLTEEQRLVLAESRGRR